MSYFEKIEAVYDKWNDTSEFFEITTSGSTGKPKVILLEKSKMAASARISLSYFGLKENDRVLLAIPADKIGGTMLIIRSIIGNLKLEYIEPKLDPFYNIDLEKNIQFCSLTPSQLASIYQNPSSLNQLRKIDKILLGGSAVPTSLLEKIHEETGQFYHSYGMTETISHIAVKNLSKSEIAFHALDNVDFEVNVESQLIIHAPEILDQPLLTNDIVDLKGPKKMIWKGRKDNVVNSGGLKLLIEEIEEKIKLEFDGEFYLTKVSDDILGEKLVMITKATPPLFKNLSKYEKPKHIHLVEEFSYTENGKLRRLTPQQLSEL
ncbi:AMP-binding protein [Portibacter lacus]|uniref:O-succinylbenzoic acid--CoA ligase n=1 Tax=Portibacter lacus TaxID=1099794 RepID=A0AA37SU00_9BACT|nr:AMP-binding protein [Portibacter lacus]GLR18108.1 O-succinylbenzoic acid--CoA ligase [Portibacter lacus]